MEIESGREFEECWEIVRARSAGFRGRSAEDVNRMTSCASIVQVSRLWSAGADIVTERLIWPARLRAGDMEQSLDGTLDANSPAIEDVEYFIITSTQKKT
ncbi:hypothetical protein Y032_0376g252 [Ancylostoma ceylanicum]|uniref:Uncharacterized protein n=1 Tax=Ancylostoma ceylanicum TaxID=53326 RepID=A0A016RUM3_9BILA|nr:hypothetical protein Y032_0376g252 [Ancylostoma ceylanicum]